ncbi:MAG TPA: diadenylate cyclase [Vicinamibacteria bacterium]|nr:diadenylate cyclase [Vicinamibacteria bacterium]
MRTQPPETKGDLDESLESRHLVRAAFELARSLGIHKMLVQADELHDIRLVEHSRRGESIIWLSRGALELPESHKSNHTVLIIPETTVLTRMSQMKLALFLAVLNGYLGRSETILCLSGVVGSERLDTLLVANALRDFPWFHDHELPTIPDLVPVREFARIMDIALRFAAEGREGKPIGTIFVLGNVSELSTFLRQLVLNPCRGHPEEARNIHDPDLVETLREYAAMDGAFIIDKKGVVEAAGTYLDAPARRASLRPGLGARHAAAASISAVSEATAVVVSESSGAITVFHAGSAILELEKPDSRARLG